jgi:hypothetical protein
MALDVYVKEDIQGHILAGLVLAMETASAQGPLNADFCAGVVAMAKYTAAAYKIPWQEIVEDAREALGADLADLLEAVPMPAVLEARA